MDRVGFTQRNNYSFKFIWLIELHIPLNLSILKINNNFPSKKSKNGHYLPEKTVSGLIKTNHILIQIELS
ncbi:hypothetical protein OkiPb00031_22800 [Escherichia coli]